MDAEVAVGNEICGALEQGLKVAHIRVTADAIQGSPAALAMTPERARGVAVIEVGGVVTADPEMVLHAAEVLLHPADFDAIVERHLSYLVAPVTSLHGYRLVHDT